MDQSPSTPCLATEWWFGCKPRKHRNRNNEGLFVDIREMPGDDLVQVEVVKSIGSRQSEYQVGQNFVWNIWIEGLAFGKKRILTFTVDRLEERRFLIIP